MTTATSIKKPSSLIITIFVLSNSFRFLNSFSPSANVGSRRDDVTPHFRWPRNDHRASLRSLERKAAVIKSSLESAVGEVPRLSQENLRELIEKKFVIIPNFLPSTVATQLREDVKNLRGNNKFKISKIGQDSTNQLNTNIRVAETCFIGKQKLQDVPNMIRENLYSMLDLIRKDISAAVGQPLDETLSELLYAYYPEGGFYRRHRDAIPGSASILRSYSLLLYLNKEDWTKEDGGELRMHFDSGGDFLPDGEKENYIDVNPTTGTLVLFKSEAIPHEVLDTQKERIAVVGWYNRPVTVADIAELSEKGGGNSPIRLAMLTLSFVLITLGLVNILN